MSQTVSPWGRMPYAMNRTSCQCADLDIPQYVKCTEINTSSPTWGVIAMGSRTPQYQRQQQVANLPTFSITNSTRMLHVTRWLMWTVEDMVQSAWWFLMTWYQIGPRPSTTHTSNPNQPQTTPSVAKAFSYFQTCWRRQAKLLWIDLDRQCSDLSLTRNDTLSYLYRHLATICMNCQ